jgi:hypothetical protein
MVGPSLWPTNGDRPQGTVAFIANGPQAAKPFWAMGSYRTVPYFLCRTAIMADVPRPLGKRPIYSKKGPLKNFLRDLC